VAGAIAVAIAVVVGIDMVALVAVAVTIPVEETERAGKSDMVIDEQDILVHVQEAQSALKSAEAVAWSALSQVVKRHSPASLWKAVLVQMQVVSVLKRVISGKKGRSARD
jgi:hypothetical protein